MNFGKLSDATQRMRRNLLFFCGVWIFINYFDVTSVKFSVIEFRTDDIGPVALATAFKVLILYHLTAFSWYLHSDWKIWNVERPQTIKEDAINELENAEMILSFQSDGRKEYVDSMDYFKVSREARAMGSAKARKAIKGRVLLFDLGASWVLSGIALFVF